MAFDPGSDLSQGADFAQKMTDTARKADAYNALAKVYGPVAGDPVRAQALQNYAFNDQVNPLKLAAAQREDAAQQQLVANNGTLAGDPNAVATQDTVQQSQRLGIYRALKALSTSVNPQTSSVDPNAFDSIVAPNAQALGLDAAHVGPLRAALTAPGGAQHLDTIAQALIGPTQATGAATAVLNPDGSSSLVRFDKYGNPIKTDLNGAVPVTQQRANQGVVGNQIKQQNANTNQQREGVYAANQTYGGGGGAPAGGAASNGGAPAAPPSAMAWFNAQPQKGRALVVGQAQQLANQATNLQNTNSILDQVDKQITPYATGAGSLIKDLPGTESANLKANLATLNAQGLTSWINSLKNAQGQTGVGRVLQSEANAAMKLYGNMEQDQTADQLAYHAKLFRSAVNQLYAHAHAGFVANYKGLTPEAVMGGDAPAAPAAPSAPAAGGAPDFSHLWK